MTWISKMQPLLICVCFRWFRPWLVMGLTPYGNTVSWTLLRCRVAVGNPIPRTKSSKSIPYNLKIHYHPPPHWPKKIIFAGRIIDIHCCGIYIYILYPHISIPFFPWQSYLHYLCSPTKSEFIRAKYQMLAFVHKLPCRDDDGVTTKDLSKVSAQYFSTLVQNIMRLC